MGPANCLVRMGKAQICSGHFWRSADFFTRSSKLLASPKRQCAPRPSSRSLRREPFGLPRAQAEAHPYPRPCSRSTRRSVQLLDCLPVLIREALSNPHNSGRSGRRRVLVAEIDCAHRAAVVIKLVSADSLRKTGIIADKAGDFPEFPRQDQQTGSSETKANTRKARISGPTSRLLESLAERMNGWLGRKGSNSHLPLW